MFTIAEARQHFHFTLNKRLDEAEDLPTATRREQQALARHLRETLARAKPVEGQGQWDKILKRVYRLAAFSKGRWLRRRALGDLLRYPGLASRIADYIRVTGTVSEFVDFAESVWGNSEQVYGDVNATLFESCLRLEPSTEDRPRLRRIAVSALRGEFDYRGSPRWQPLGPLLVLRFGDRRSLPRLKSCFDRDLDRVSPQVSRAAAVVFAGHGRTEELALREAASRLHRNHLSELVRMLDRIHEYDSVPDRWHLRCKPVRDGVGRVSFVDMRALVAVRLLGLSTDTSVEQWLKNKRRDLLAAEISDFDRGLIRRLWPR